MANFQYLGSNFIKNLVEENDRFRRITSMLLDHMIVCFIILPPIIIFTLFINKTVPSMKTTIDLFSISLIILVYFNKDFFRAKSAAKRLLGYQIIDVKTRKNASELQCFLRNLTILFAWPLEVVICFIYPRRRIGDFIANTTVIRGEEEKLKSIWLDVKSTTFKPSYVTILIIGCIYIYLFLSILNML